MVNQRDGMKIEMLAIILSSVGKFSRSSMSRIQFVAMTMLVIGTHLRRGEQRVYVLVSADMPMRVRTREPCSQQGYTDQQGDSRGCLAEMIQH